MQKWADMHVETNYFQVLIAEFSEIVSKHYEGVFLGYNNSITFFMKKIVFTKYLIMILFFMNYK